MKQLLILVVLAFASLHVGAQTSVQERLRLARAYESAGDTKSAARMFQEILDERPEDRNAFDGVVRTLSSLQQHASLAPLIERRLKTKNELDVAVLYGEVLWKAGKTSEAIDAWQQAAQLGGESEDVLRIIAERQAAATATKAAMQSYLRAREKNGSAAVYSMEIGRLALASGEIQRGIEETLLDYREREDYLFTQGQLAIVLAQPGGTELLRTALDGNDGATLRLRQWFFRETKAWKEAYDVAKELDRSYGARGQELFQFGEQARLDGRYELALQAYDDVVQSSTASDQWKQNALYWYVRTLDQRLRGSASVDRATAEQVLDRYGEIIRKNPTLWFASDALYHSAVLAYDVLRDRDRARSYLERLVSQWRGTIAAADGLLLLASMYVADDNLNRALDILQIADQTASTPQLQSKRDAAAVLRADILWWNGNMDSAQRIYAAIARQPGSSAANDALDRIFMIQSVDTDSMALQMMIQADRARVERRYDKAGERYRQAADVAKEPDVRDRCLWMAARAYLDARDTTSAEPLLAELVKDIPRCLYGDQALWTSAALTASKGDTARAITLLNTLLVAYPRSILIPSTRDRIRALRGDA